MVLGKGAIALAVSAALLAGCSGGNKPSPRALKQIDRALERAPGKAQPSIIVKTELAFARAARESGQKKAFQSFAAPGAKFHAIEGVVDALTFVEDQGRLEAQQWSTKSVLMSCDGSTAVSQGRLTENGQIGDYVFVWERQPGLRTKGGEETGYRFVYFAAAPDDPQPAPRVAIAPPDPNGIVVEALDAVRADIATCGPREDIYLNSLAEPAQGVQVGSSQSRDKTLQWDWFHYPNGRRQLKVSLWRKGSRETAFTQDLPSSQN